MSENGQFFKGVQNVESNLLNKSAFVLPFVFFLLDLSIKLGYQGKVKKP